MRSLRVCFRLVIVALIAASMPAHAIADGLEVYSPEEQETVYALEVHGAAVAPIEQGPVCPRGAACVLGGGFGLGGLLIGRAPDGFGLLVGYEVWLLDGGGLYEIAALHALRLGARWVLDQSSLAQPFLQATAGAILLSDPAVATTAGAMLTVGGGLEVELTRTVSVSLAAELTFSTLAPFSTRDGIARAADFGVNVALQTSAGLVVVLGPTGAR